MAAGGAGGGCGHSTLAYCLGSVLSARRGGFAWVSPRVCSSSRAAKLLGARPVMRKSTKQSDKEISSFSGSDVLGHSGDVSCRLPRGWPRLAQTLEAPIRLGDGSTSGSALLPPARPPMPMPVSASAPFSQSPPAAAEALQLHLAGRRFGVRTVHHGEWY